MLKEISPQRLQKILMLAVLIALQIIISRFSFGSHLARYDLTFVVIFLIGYWYKPLDSAIAEGITDILGSLLNGFGFFIGFTISAILTGLITSWIFHKRPKITWTRIVCYQLIISIAVDLVLNTLWIMILLHVSLITILIPRIVKELICFPIQIFILYKISNSKALEQLTNRFFK